jgi:hypothetical protein
MKYFFIFLFFISTLFGNTISLSGEYAKNDLGNSFRVLLEKKEKKISIFSMEKDVILKVENDLKNRDIFNRQFNEYPTKVILRNASVENVLKAYYSEEFKVEIDGKANVIVNVLDGKIELEHFFNDDTNIRPLLKRVEVSLNIEIIKNGVKTVKNIVMDDKLEMPVSYKDFLTSKDFKKEALDFDITVNRIIENIIYKGILK